MKKVFTLFAVMALLTSVSFAQGTAHRGQNGKQTQKPAAALKAQLKKQAAKTSAKAAGDTISSFPWIEDFENGTTGFTFVDSDNDGFNWQLMSASADNWEVFSGDACMASASYDNEGQLPLTPDNWMILPAIEIPASATDFTLSWYEIGEDASYADEYYSVYITTTGHSVSNFTATTPVYSGVATGVWLKKTVNLGSYAGQTIHIAFRHYNVTDMFYLNIDNIRVGNPEPPTVSVSGPTSVIVNNPATFYAQSDETYFEWFVDGTAQFSSNGSSMTTTFTTPGNHQIVVSVSNVSGTTSDTLDVNAIDCNVITGAYTEDFEISNPCWQFVSADPINDDRAGLNTSEFHSGNSSFAFSSFYAADNYNQFLISPELSLTDTDYMVSFWFMGYNSNESFRVMVSTTTSDTAAFTTVLGDYPTVSTDWTYVAFQIPANAKYIAFNYYSNYQYYLYIDEFAINPMGAPAISLSGAENVGTGVEVNYVANVSLANSVNWYVDGVAVSADGNILTYTFTTVGNHTVTVEASNDYGTSSASLDVNVFSCDGTTLPYAPDFSDGLGCWFSRSYETEESGWFASVDMFENNPEGQILSMSAQSYLGVFMMDFLVDNWIYSPVITMPASGNFQVSWSVKPYMTDYPGDHYGVYAINNNDTILLYEETLNSNMTDFVERTAAIPSTINGEFRIAFRHWNCEGGYVIIIDDIELNNLTAPSVSINGPASAMTGDEVTFTAVSGTATSFAWMVDDSYVAETSNILTTSFATAGNHTVSVTATNAVGSTTATVTIYVSLCDAITSFPFYADFEDESEYGCWRFVDADGDGYGWDYLSGSGTDGSGLGYNSNTAMASASYVNGFGALTPDNWMILPAMTLPQGQTLTLSWYAKGQDASFSAENYSVYVSTTGFNISNFNDQLFNGVTSGEWERQNVNLAAYAGQTIRIAFRHYDVTDMFYLDIDDIRVEAGAGISDVENSNMSIYPNPANDIVNVSINGVEGNVNVQIVDINGRTVKEVSGNAQSMNIEVGNLSRGTYFVRMTGENVNVVRKLVLK